MPVTGDVRVALAAGFAILAVAVAIVLSGSPHELAGTNAIEPLSPALASVPGAGSGCQANETLPAHSTAIRLSLEASAGPRVAVAVRWGKSIVAHGESAAGWVGKAVTVPVEPLDRTLRHTTVCFAFTGAEERVSLLGAHTPARGPVTSAGRVLPGRISVEYLRSGSSSWWSLVPSVARRMGLGRAWAGTWVVVLVAGLMATGIAVAARLTVGESR